MATDTKVTVLFLDRDGTINVDIGPEYVSDPKQLKLIPGAAKALARAREAGFKLAVITNQAGVAKGLMRADALPHVHEGLEKLVATEAGLAEFHFDDLRVCIHHPDKGCDCRKPGTRMLRDSIEALNADVARSFFVGDKDSDLLCAKAMGVRSILVLTGHGKATEAEIGKRGHVFPAGIEPSLAEAVDLAISLNVAVSADVDPVS